MKAYKKYIFDLDYTILIPDWSKEDDYFKTCVPIAEQEEFFKQKQDIIGRYELLYPQYNLKTLSDYFKTHGFSLSEEDIYGWMNHNKDNINDTIPDGVIDLFTYLKEKGKDIVVLTSWFSLTQIERLKRSGLYPFIDKVVCGDDAMKPRLLAFTMAIGDTPLDECIMIGDSIRSDKQGAINAGIDSFIVDDANTIRDFYNMVKEEKPFVRVEK